MGRACSAPPVWDPRISHPRLASGFPVSAAPHAGIAAYKKIWSVKVNAYTKAHAARMPCLTLRSLYSMLPLICLRRSGMSAPQTTVNV